uniref:Uncharacterized protein n=1 Tax=Rhizophora mucronata TaxID=61149 RepID=A0A2P2NVH5_RHIMU
MHFSSNSWINSRLQLHLFVLLSTTNLPDIVISCESLLNIWKRSEFL